MRTRQFLFLVLIAGLVLMRESRIEPLASVENSFASWLNTNAKREPSRAPLVLLEITDDDLSATPWPWSPFDFSLAVSAALSFEPAVLALEPVLSWEAAKTEQITLLHHQLLRVPKLLLGADLGVSSTLLPPLQEIPLLPHVKGETGALPEYNAVAQRPVEELRLAGALGFENLPGRGETLQRVPLVFRYYGHVVPSFVLQAAMLWYGVTPDEVTVVPGGYVALGEAVRIPIDARGTFAVDFGIPITRLSVGDLILAAAQDQKPTAGAAPRIKGSFALVARNDGASRMLHFANRSGSRGEFFAQSIATIQQQAFIRRIPVYGEACIIAAGIALAWYASRKSRLATVTLGVAAVAAYMLIALGIFAGTFIALPLLLPVGLIGFVVLLRLID